MAELVREKCTACRKDAPAVTDEEISELSPQIPDWEIVREDGIPKLQRSYTFDDFEQALRFTSHVGDMAEVEGHHPRIVTEYGKVTVTWWTHKIRNLHRNDFIAAAKTDAIFIATPRT